MNEAPLLICYDDSTGARHAVESAATLFPGRRAVVLDVAPAVTAQESLADLAPVIPNFEEINTADALSKARVGAEFARAHGLEAEPRADFAAPTWDGVVEAANDLDAAVIVIGSRGLRGAREVFEGSLSHEVAEHAGRPVLIVPPARQESH